MCCTITKKRSKSLTTQETKIYTKEKMLQKSQEERTKSLFFEYGDLKFCILYTKNYFSSTGLSHLAFYAMSRGFEAFTETGYHSIFAQGGEDVGIEDVEEYIKSKLTECGIDLDNPKPQILVHVGGISHIEQPSLF